MKLRLPVFIFKISDAAVKPHELTSHFVLVCWCYFVSRTERNLTNCFGEYKLTSNGFDLKCESNQLVIP